MIVLLLVLAGSASPGPMGAQVLAPQRLFDSSVSARLMDADAGVRSEALSEAKKDVLLLLPTVPVTFNALEKNDAGDWQMGEAILFGAGATFILGKASFEGVNASVQPWIIAGAAVNAGVKDDAEEGVTEALTASLFVGLADVALSFSRDLLGGGTSIGISLKVDLITNLAPDAFMCLSGCAR